MKKELAGIKKEFTEGMSHISRFWGLPQGVGALFAVLYLSPAPLCLDELVLHSGLTKGAVSTNMRALARMGLVHRSSRLADRRDYYEAEIDFYKSIRTLLGERQNREFGRAVGTVRETLENLKAAKGSGEEAERRFLLGRVQALQDFFDAIDNLARTVSRLDGLGLSTVQKVLSILK